MKPTPTDTQTEANTAPDKDGEGVGSDATCSAPEGYLGLFFIPFFWSFVIFGIGSMIFHSFGIMPFLAGAMLALALAKLKADYEADVKLEAAFRRLRESEHDEQNTKLGN